MPLSRLLGSVLVLSCPLLARAGTVQNLAATGIDTAGITGDWQKLKITGTVKVDVSFAFAAAPIDFDVTVFDDRNANGTFDAGDSVLGSALVDAGATTSPATIDVPVSGMVDFREDLIFAKVDAQALVPESTEADNQVDSSLTCEFAPTVGAVDPALEWSWTASAVEPGSLNVMMTPAVIDLTGDGVPEVVFASTASTGGSLVEIGILRALDGATGAELWNVTDPTLRVNTAASVAAADIDGDGRPEIVACDDSGVRLICFEHDGAFKWRSAALDGIYWGAPSIANLDGAGLPEIVMGRTALDANGVVLWTGTGGLGSVGNTGPLSMVADVDLDGSPDVVAGNTCYNADGTIKWSNTLADGHGAIANFDGDPNPEIVLVTSGFVYLLEHTGSIKWGPIGIVGGGTGGPPTVADYDGDGLPEIGVAGASAYCVYEHTGALKWSSGTQNGSSNRTGSSVFDFDGDGSAEVVYRDELFLRVYRGTDGMVLFTTEMSSCTWHEYVLVADVDADGNAELVAVANNNCGLGPQRGVFVFGSASDSWVPTRRIWNQHTYHITNVNDDGSIPLVEPNNWLVPPAKPFNNYRQNVLSSGVAQAAPDLTASHIKVTGDPAAATASARVGNGGSALIPLGVSVSFYNGDPTGGGQLLGTAPTTIALDPGEYQDVGLALPVAVGLIRQIFAVADDAGGLTGNEDECDETNNAHGAPLRAPQFTAGPCGAPLNASVGVALTFDVVASDSDPGDLVALSAGPLPAGATFVAGAAANPATGTFAWTPSNAQAGTHVITFTAQDCTCLTATCTVSITVGECYLFAGPQSAGLPLSPSDMLVVQPLSSFAVTLESIPYFVIPNDPGLIGASIAFQVLMMNPDVFPTDPVKASNGLLVVIGQGATEFGAKTGMTLWNVTAPQPGKKLVLKFSID